MSSRTRMSGCLLPRSSKLQHILSTSQADREGVDEASLADLDGDALQRLLSRRPGARALRHTSTDAERLTRLSVTDNAGRVRLAGLPAVGAYPQQFFPRLFIDVTVHPGNEKSLPGNPVRFSIASVAKARSPT